MAAMAALLALIIGGGFVATEYVKKHPEMFEVKPQK